MALANGEKKTEPQRERLLGAYLFALCVYQIGIYCWPGGPPFILDPRAGIPVLLINHFSFDNKVIYPVEWITATWLVIAAAMIFFRGRFLKPYLIAEIVLAAPTAYYICVLAIRHGGRFRAGVQGPRLDRAVVPCFFTDSCLGWLRDAFWPEGKCDPECAGSDFLRSSFQSDG